MHKIKIRRKKKVIVGGENIVCRNTLVIPYTRIYYRQKTRERNKKYVYAIVNRICVTMISVVIREREPSESIVCACICVWVTKYLRAGADFHSYVRCFLSFISISLQLNVQLLFSDWITAKYTDSIETRIDVLISIHSKRTFFFCLIDVCVCVCVCVLVSFVLVGKSAFVCGWAKVIIWFCDYFECNILLVKYLCVQILT